MEQQQQEQQVQAAAAATATETDKPKFNWAKWTKYNPETYKAEAAEEIVPGIRFLKIVDKKQKSNEARLLEVGDKATFRFLARRKREGEATEYSSWYDKASGVLWKVGECSIITALKCALLRIYAGERALVWAQPEHAYGFLGELAGQTILFEVELTSVEYKKHALDDRSLTDADRLADARRARAAGRAYLEKKPVAHSRALKEFNRALQLLDQIVVDPDAEADGEAEAIAEEKFFLHLNDAYVYILRSKMGVATEWKKAVEHSRAAVELQKSPDAPEAIRGNAKAYYRLGCAYLGMGDPTAALMAAQTAAQLAPGDKAVARLIADVEAFQRAIDKSSPFLGMFNK